MPVEAHDLHGLVVRPPAGEEARTRAIVVSPPDLSCSSDEEDHAEGHVGSMKARDREKGRAKLGRAKRVAPGAYAFLHDQLGPLEGLHADEGDRKSTRLTSSH